MSLLTRRALLTGAAALVLPVAGAVLTHTGREPVKLPMPSLPYPRRNAAKVVLSSVAKLPLGIDPIAFTKAMQRYVTEFLTPVWGCYASLSWSAKPVVGAMNMIFADQTDAEDAIAYHNFDPKLQLTPYAQIGVEDSYENATGDLGVPFSHELGEMLVNPGINLWAGVGSFIPAGDEGGPAGASLRAYEIADPVERTFFLLDGVRMSNFVYPAYFEPWRDGPLDYLRLLKAPGDILDGGYQLIRDHESLQQVINSGNTDYCARVRRLLKAA